MGLDCSHDAWHGPYSSFGRWRNELAKAAGYIVAPVEFKGGVTRETILIDWGHITLKNLSGEWEETPKDPLLVLIAHNDCEGKIYPKQATALANRIEELLPLLPRNEAVDGAFIGICDLDLVEATRKFIKGLRAAAKKNEPLVFS